MFSKSRIFFAASAAIASFAVAAPASAVVLQNSPNSSIGTFGANGTQTYGQVFTAPITGTLSSFTMWLNGGVTSLFGGVGTWNGTAAYGDGFGSPTNLYQSANVAAPGAGAFTFTPGTAVTAGQRYVAYLSVFGVPGATGSVSMPTTSIDVAGIDYFVWNNTSDPRNNANWNYFANFGDAQFSATFNAGVAGVPEPAAWAMMIAGFGLVGGAMRKRTKVSVSYA